MKKRRRRRSKFSIILMSVLLLAAALAYFYPDICDLRMRWEISRELSQYNQILEGKKADYSDMWEAAEEYNRYLAAKPSQYMLDADEKEWIGGLLNPAANNMMGVIDVPKIRVHLPVWQGTEEKQLQSGAGWMFGSSLPTGGESTHCVITAHNGLVKAELFTHLEKLEEGDTFSLTVLDRVLTYQVDQILVTEPEDISALKIVPGEDLVTLYTCTPYGINTHRLLVRGHRIPTPEQSTPVLVEMARENPAPWLLGLAGLLLLLLLLFLWRRRRKKKRAAQTAGGEKNGRKEEPHGTDEPETFDKKTKEGTD